ncbi:acyl-CoA dehydrogenase family protein [Edaphosphingomonas haloaromaticamans]|uniref:Acyl-CoA dehydrogenase, short-chain specific n=1 Tax=Edaphosphingomonas haloaromaticamans TaxID=653954 RepID=A0A1S1HIY7_9SPHN|nr:acyl-CoA dehydrogenase family protein [Sphingomonas haloaromaticamans]OHT21183.1 Acyl-CoA dehydrogenase, short-chain specific [Sphingomonas haloaromaticamans]
MSAGLTDDQIFIRDSARDFLRDRADFDALRKAVDGAGWDRALWDSFAGELGFAGIGVAEAHGGAGLGPVELALIAEELGRTLAPIPWFETAVLAATAIAEAGGEAQQAALLGPIARGETIATLAMRDAAGGPIPEGIGPVLEKDGGGYRLSGRAHFVPFGADADLLIVAAREPGSAGWDGISLIALAAAGLEREALTSLDLTRPLAHVDLDVTIGADAILGAVGAAGPALRRTLAIASGILASEQVGGMQRTLDETVEYSKQRVQFGRVIGSFQAMKHRMADMKLWLEAARSAAAMAADAIARDAGDMETLSAAARSYCSDAYLRIAADGIQLHGGIGFTWEHHAHLFFKRARGTATLLDSPAHHRELIARAIIDTEQAA